MTARSVTLMHSISKITVCNIKYLKNGNAQGSLLYIEHRPTGDVKLKSNALSAMAIVGNEAIPTGKATVNGVVITASLPGSSTMVSRD